MPNYVLKPGVVSAGVQAPISSALDVAASIYQRYGQQLTVTSLLEGQHVPNSRHYVGQAADLRTNIFDDATKRAIASELQAALGSGYRVIVESDHIHFQSVLDSASPLALPQDDFADWATPENPLQTESGIGPAAMIGFGLAAALLFTAILD